MTWFYIYFDKKCNKSEVIIVLIEIDIYSIFFEIFTYFSKKRQN